MGNEQSGLAGAEGQENDQAGAAPGSDPVNRWGNPMWDDIADHNEAEQQRQKQQHDAAVSVPLSFKEELSQRKSGPRRFSNLRLAASSNKTRNKIESPNAFSVSYSPSPEYDDANEHFPSEGEASDRDSIFNKQPEAGVNNHNNDAAAAEAINYRYEQQVEHEQQQKQSQAFRGQNQSSSSISPVVDELAMLWDAGLSQQVQRGEETDTTFNSLHTDNDDDITDGEFAYTRHNETFDDSLDPGASGNLPSINNHHHPGHNHSKTSLQKSSIAAIRQQQHERYVTRLDAQRQAEMKAIQDIERRLKNPIGQAYPLQEGEEGVNRANNDQKHASSSIDPLPPSSFPSLSLPSLPQDVAMDASYPAPRRVSLHSVQSLQSIQEFEAEGNDDDDDPYLSSEPNRPYISSEPNQPSSFSSSLRRRQQLGIVPKEDDIEDDNNVILQQVMQYVQQIAELQARSNNVEGSQGPDGQIMNNININDTEDLELKSRNATLRVKGIRLRNELERLLGKNNGMNSINKNNSNRNHKNNTTNNNNNSNNLNRKRLGQFDLDLSEPVPEDDLVSIVSEVSGIPKDALMDENDNLRFENRRLAEKIKWLRRSRENDRIRLLNEKLAAKSRALARKRKQKKIARRLAQKEAKLRAERAAIQRQRQQERQQQPQNQYYQSRPVQSQFNDYKTNEGIPEEDENETELQVDYGIDDNDPYAYGTNTTSTTGGTNDRFQGGGPRPGYKPKKAKASCSFLCW